MNVDYVLLQKFSHRKNQVMFVKNYFMTFGKCVWLGTFRESAAYRFESTEEARKISNAIDNDESGSIIIECGKIKA